MPTILVRSTPRDHHLWDGTLNQLSYYVEKVWKPQASESDPLILDFSRCRVGPKVADYIFELMKSGIKCINTRDIQGLPEIYDSLQKASEGKLLYKYVPINIQTTYKGIVDEATRLKQIQKDYSPEENDGKDICFYIKADEESKWANTNVIPANMSYYMLTRMSLNFDPFYNGLPNSEKFDGPRNKFILKNIFRFIENDIGVPPEFYNEGDRSVWVVDENNLLQKLYFNKDGVIHPDSGHNMYYYPGIGWYTLNDLRRMNMVPLPGFLFITSISKRSEFLRSLQLACMKIKPNTKKVQEGSALLRFLETYKDTAQGEYNE